MKTVFTVFLLEDRVTCPRQSIKEFELSLPLGQVLGSLISWVNIYFSIILVVGKLAHFTIIYALFLALTETVFEYALSRQGGCRVYFGNKEVA